MDAYTVLIYFLPLGALIAGAAMFTGNLLSIKTKESAHKREAYECGEVIIGDARIQFKVGYYLFALLFVIFDVESLFLFPVARIFRGQVASGLAPHLLLDLAIFVVVLSLGLAYAWRKGALKWD
ncbi:MAG: NADH-quinone oxidoreductase subunit A [Spirochaetes bacterium]|nr:NADH-quinone oxidoreductase subunit A [Spirochaetota bacterium]